jgi:DNA-binding protein Fis
MISIKKKVQDQVMWKVLDQIYLETLHQGWNKIYDQVWWEVKNPVGNKILQNIDGDLYK